MTVGARRGRPPLISRAAILAAAREIPVGELSIQAVATRLGVARRSVARYVAGAEDLRRLVAAADLADELATVDLPHGDWRAALGGYVEAMRRVLLANPAAAMLLDEIPLAGPLALVEQLVSELLDAGVAPDDAARTIELVDDVTLASVRRFLAVRGSGARPLASDALAVARRRPESYPSLRRLIEATGALPVDADDPFAIDVIIEGLERRLARP